MQSFVSLNIIVSEINHRMYLFSACKQDHIFQTMLHNSLLNEVGPYLVEKLKWVPLSFTSYEKLLKLSTYFHLSRIDPIFEKISKLDIVYSNVVSNVSETHPGIGIKFATPEQQIELAQKILFRLPKINMFDCEEVEVSFQSHSIKTCLLMDKYVCMHLFYV